MKKIRNEDLGITPETEFIDAPDGETAGLTDEDAEALALEAIRRRNLVPGGKSLSGGGKHSPVLQVRLPEELRARLHERAVSEGVGDSKIARAAIEAYLNAS